MFGLALNPDALVDVVVERRQAGVDGQGRPSYATAETTRARVLEYASEKANQFTAGTGGSQTRYHATAYYAPTEDGDDVLEVAPREGDRVVTGGQTYIVGERKVVRGLGGVIAHVRIRLRLQGSPS